MTAKQIMQALELGATITENRYMNLKYGKLVIGEQKRVYKIGEQTIKAPQFENIQYLLTKVSEDFNSKTYKLKTKKNAPSAAESNGSGVFGIHKTQSTPIELTLLL